MFLVYAENRSITIRSIRSFDTEMEAKKYFWSSASFASKIYETSPDKPPRLVYSFSKALKEGWKWDFDQNCYTKDPRDIVKSRTK